MKYSTYFQHEVNYFIPKRKKDRRLMSVYVIVEPYYFENNTIPCYKIVAAKGFEHIEGVIFSTTLDRLTPIKY